MKRINAQLEAMLRDFQVRSSTGPQRAVQLRAAVEASELTLRAFNAAAAAGTMRSFQIDTEGNRANHVGRFDSERGSVSLPSSAFRDSGAAPTPDLIATCRVQSMLVAFASGVVTDGGKPVGGASPEMVRNLQNTLNGSPYLASEFKRAATTKDPTSPHKFGLERFELLPSNANIGGAYVGETHTMLLPAGALVARPGRTFNAAALTFVVGHEVQHAFNRADALQATVALRDGVNHISQSSSPIHDYTPVLAAYLGEVRKDEARGQIAGWNAVQSWMQASGKPVTLQAMGEADNRMRDFVPFVPGLQAAAHPDIALNEDMTISPTPGNIEALGKHYFDRPTRDHFPSGSNERVMGLNHDHVSNYPNHYGKQAIEQILAAEKKAPLFQGRKPEPTFDMARLGLFEDVLERQGLDLTKSHGNGEYFDSTQLPAAPRTFNHTVEGKHAHQYVPVAPDNAPPLPTRLDLPAHPDHEFFRQVRRHVVELDRSLGRAPDHYTDNISSALTVQARADGLERVDHIELSERGDAMRAMQMPKGRTNDQFTLRSAVATAEASTSMEESASKWPDAMRQFEVHEQGRAERQESVLGRGHTVPNSVVQVAPSPEHQHLSLNDPRNPNSRNHDLYNELERCLPNASEERLVQFTAACHRHRITAKNLSGLHVDYDSMTLSIDSDGLVSTTAVVDLSTPPPEPEQAIQQIRQFDQQMEEIRQQSQQQAA
nr:XVIPCD domain-containing protein [Luteibacter rhizovicinus]